MRQPGRRQDERGFTLVDMLFVLGLIGVLSAIAVPRMLLAKQSAGAASALASLRSISSAELTFALTCGGGFYAPSLTTLGTPPPGSPEPFLSPNLTSADTVTHSGYVFQLEGAAFPGAPATCNGLNMGASAQSYKAGADPTFTDAARFFAINSAGQIYEHTDSLYASMPEIGEPALGHVLK